MASVEFSYEGRNIVIQCNEYDTMEKIFQKFATKAQVNLNSLLFLYNGTTIANKNLTFDQLSNNYDKDRNKMNILASYSLSNSAPEFIFLKCIGANESMKDYAKMAILLAMKEYPDDYEKKNELIAEKFEEKYGDYWSCSFMKFNEGSALYRYFDYFLKIKYGDYKIYIVKTSDGE